MLGGDHGAIDVILDGRMGSGEDERWSGRRKEGGKGGKDLMNCTKEKFASIRRGRDGRLCISLKESLKQSWRLNLHIPLETIHMFGLE